MPKWPAFCQVFNFHFSNLKFPSSFHKENVGIFLKRQVHENYSKNFDILSEGPALGLGSTLVNVNFLTEGPCSKDHCIFQAGNSFTLQQFYCFLQLH